MVVCFYQQSESRKQYKVTLVNRHLLCSIKTTPIGSRNGNISSEIKETPEKIISTSILSLNFESKYKNEVIERAIKDIRGGWKHEPNSAAFGGRRRPLIKGCLDTGIQHVVCILGCQSIGGKFLTFYPNQAFDF